MTAKPGKSSELTLGAGNGSRAIAFRRVGYLRNSCSPLPGWSKNQPELRQGQARAKHLNPYRRIQSQATEPVVTPLQHKRRALASR